MCCTLPPSLRNDPHTTTCIHVAHLVEMVVEELLVVQMAGVDGEEGEGRMATGCEVVVILVAAMGAAVMEVKVVMVMVMVLMVMEVAMAMLAVVRVQVMVAVKGMGAQEKAGMERATCRQSNHDMQRMYCTFLPSLRNDPHTTTCISGALLVEVGVLMVAVEKAAEGPKAMVVAAMVAEVAMAMVVAVMAV